MFSWRDDPSFDPAYRSGPEVEENRDRWCPAADTYETENGLVLLFDLAGVTREDIQLTVHGLILTLRGCRPDPAGESKLRLHQIEIDYGAFERRIRLPEGVDPERITASFRDGFLRVELPRQETTPGGRILIHGE